MFMTNYTESDNHSRYSKKCRSIKQIIYKFAHACVCVCACVYVYIRSNALSVKIAIIF